MIANYGYEDGSGHYYIKIDTGKCAECTGKFCIEACPEKLFITEMDDFDEEIVCIREDGRHTLGTSCAYCKANGHNEKCIAVCELGAIVHTW